MPNRPIAHVAVDIGISRACASRAVNRHRQFGDAPGLGLDDRDQQGRVLMARVQGLERAENGRAGDLDLGIQVRRPVLQRLELADQLSELGAGLQIVERDLERLVAGADQAGGGAGAGPRRR